MALRIVSPAGLSCGVYTRAFCIIGPFSHRKYRTIRFCWHPCEIAHQYSYVRDCRPRNLIGFPMLRLGASKISLFLRLGFVHHILRPRAVYANKCHPFTKKSKHLQRRLLPAFLSRWPLELYLDERQDRNSLCECLLRSLKIDPVLGFDYEQTKWSIVMRRCGMLPRCAIHSKDWLYLERAEGCVSMVSKGCNKLVEFNASTSRGLASKEAVPEGGI